MAVRSHPIQNDIEARILVMGHGHKQRCRIPAQYWKRRRKPGKDGMLDSARSLERDKNSSHTWFNPSSGQFCCQDVWTPGRHVKLGRGVKNTVLNGAWDIFEKKSLLELVQLHQHGADRRVMQ